MLRGAVQKLTLPLGRGLAGAGITPNMVTFFGFAVVVTACVFIVRGSQLVAGLILTAGGLLDAVDGAVARGSGKITKFGAFFDSTLDRLSDALMVGAVAWFFATSSGSAIPQWAASWATNELAAAAAGAALVFGFMTSYIRARAEGLGFSCEVGVAERTERVVLVAAGLILNLLFPAIIILALLSAFTAAHRFIHVRNQAAEPR